MSANPFEAFKIYNVADVSSATDVSSANNGGLESNGDLATLIAKRNFNRIKLNEINSNSMNQVQGHYSHNDDSYRANFTIFNQMQIPPIVMIEKDVNSNNFGYSYRFNNKYRIDLNQLHALFGLSSSSEDPELLKIQSSHLMTQLIEVLEAINRIKIQDNKLYINSEFVAIKRLTKDELERLRLCIAAQYSDGFYEFCYTKEIYNGKKHKEYYYCVDWKNVTIKQTKLY